MQQRPKTARVRNITRAQSEYGPRRKSLLETPSSITPVDNPETTGASTSPKSSLQPAYSIPQIDSLYSDGGDSDIIPVSNTVEIETNRIANNEQLSQSHVTVDVQEQEQANDDVLGSDVRCSSDDDESQREEMVCSTAPQNHMCSKAALAAIQTPSFVSAKVHPAQTGLKLKEHRPIQLCQYILAFTQLL